MPAANLFHRFRRLRRVSKSLSHALALLGGLLVFVPVIAIAAQGLSAINLVTTTEYYYTPLDYYFITSRDSDKAALDGSRRTGARLMPRATAANTPPPTPYSGADHWHRKNEIGRASCRERV